MSDAQSFLTEILDDLTPTPENTGPDFKIQSGLKKEKSEKERVKDPYGIAANLKTYIGHSIKLRTNFANKLFGLLVLEVLLMFVILVLHGTQLIFLESWLVSLFVESIIIQTFFTINIIVNNLFPKKNLIEALSDFSN